MNSFNLNPDVIRLQQDLDNLVFWAQIWQMKFQPSKCYVLKICQTTNITVYPYSVLGRTLKVVSHVPYLRITLTETLSWKMHILNIKKKVGKALGFIKRSLYQCPKEVKSQVYKALVRPIMEYGSTVWDLYREYQKTVLEKILWQAARFAANTYGREKGSVTRALSRRVRKREGKWLE